MLLYHLRNTRKSWFYTYVAATKKIEWITLKIVKYLGLSDTNSKCTSSPCLQALRSIPSPKLHWERRVCSWQSARCPSTCGGMAQDAQESATTWVWQKNRKCEEDSVSLEVAVLIKNDWGLSKPYLQITKREAPFSISYDFKQGHWSNVLRPQS